MSAVQLATPTNRTYLRRRRVNAAMIALSTLALAFGLFWLVWIIGVLLWEATVGERLFKRDTEPLTILAVMTQRVTPPSELVGVLLAKLATPFADGLRRHDHATFQQQFFHIAEA